MVKGYKSITEKEKAIILKTYDELDVLQAAIEKIYGDRDEISTSEEAEVEKLVVQMEAIYARIESIEKKVMVELYGENYEFAGGDCGPMSDYEIGEGLADDYINSLDVLTNDEKAKLSDAYNRIETLFAEYDKIEESKLEGPEAQNILTQVDKIYIEIKDIEDKISLSYNSEFETATSADTLESTLQYVDSLNLDENTKSELKKLYTEVFKLYDNLSVFYQGLGENEVNGEFSEKDRVITVKLEEIYNKISELEQRAK